ncbi:hypothetical protein B5S33_g4846 [[Candida] boidinii]|nr:hypothetical protein B5S30_g4926 [[Candida] boidinii]OWB86164.1 hypothetical protein B5S33_g4846 [[Candida] boidinii]
MGSSSNLSVGFGFLGIGGTFYYLLNMKETSNHITNHISLTKFGILNIGLVSIYCFINLTKWIFFGSLTLQEYNNLKEKICYTIYEFIIGLLIFKFVNYSNNNLYQIDRINWKINLAKFAFLFLCIFLLKCFHYTTSIRLSSINNYSYQNTNDSTNSDNNINNIKKDYKLKVIRLFFGISLMHYIDLKLIKLFYNEIKQNNLSNEMSNLNSLLYIFGFEILNLYPLIIINSISFLICIFDNYKQIQFKEMQAVKLKNMSGNDCQRQELEEEEEGREGEESVYENNWKFESLRLLEVLGNLLRLLNLFTFNSFFMIKYTIPAIHIIPESYTCFKTILVKSRELINLNKNLKKIKILKKNCSIPNQLSSNKTDNLCIICREELSFSDKFQPVNSQNRVVMIKKCTHSFHWDCLSNWIVQSNSCPICRIPTN